ncbi:MAG: glycogen debranching enzyme N-terminal domain-containing protein [Desulfobacterium sp.]|nr:glycogen debranching enzyme N-terminal domain-containing protein [Desulfobacterium sp.]
MKVSDMIFQHPTPGTSKVMFCGDVVTFTLKVPSTVEGMAWIRTNLGRATVARGEIIARVDRNEIKLNEAWHDIQMVRFDPTTFSITLPLWETGHFKAKCFFFADDSDAPVWPPGENCVINVEPAGSCCANIVYNAFVRQFGPTKCAAALPEGEEEARWIKALDKKKYSVIPCSGTFRDLKAEVDYILSHLGCRAIHLLPIHPTPTTYARMGRFGSPYAALNFTDVDPALAEFDPGATPLEQFTELVDRIHSCSGYLILDIAINHTGWAASIHERHPEWLVRSEEGEIQVPGAWGVQWEDLTRLDYSKKALWRYMADIFLLWCSRGVDGFRCDAGYMIPVPAWEYMVARVKQEYPDTLFFLEGLGGPVAATRDILDRANFNWAYSELFQNYDRQALETYLPSAMDISERFGHMIHFAETHDNPRLAAVSHDYAVMRTSLCALFSVCGGFGFTNGVEWFATRKIDVHESVSLNWGAKVNQTDHIRRLNLILKTHPAFASNVCLRLVHQGTTNCVALSRAVIGEKPGEDKEVVVLANLDCDKAQEVAWTAGGPAQGPMFDLVTERKVLVRQQDGLCRLELMPGEVVALTRDKDDVPGLRKADVQNLGMPERVVFQKQRAKVLKIVTALTGYGDVSGMDLKGAAQRLIGDPVAFVRSVNPDGNESRVVVWQWERDVGRQVMVPHGFLLMVTAPDTFRAEIRTQNGNNATTLGQEEALAMADGGFFAIFLPMDTKGRIREYILKLRVFASKGTREAIATLVYLPGAGSAFVSSVSTRKAIAKDPSLKLLGVNHRGGMMRAFAWWGRLESRYDALLAANINPDYPEDRWMALARCRIWVTFQGYSRELCLDCLDRFIFSYDNAGIWRFRVPTSEGNHCLVELTLKMIEDKNSLELTISRPTAGHRDHLLDDSKPVTVIIRPDMEYRSFHETVKAWQGPEKHWKEAVTMVTNGFVFAPEPDHCSLRVGVSLGSFVWEPEWQYMVHRPLDAQRGLDSESDLFSPGYFIAPLKGNSAILLAADVNENRVESRVNAYTGHNDRSMDFARGWPLTEALMKSLTTFVVGRGDDKSVIAGYPWFLDWGRDSLIFCRALIQAGRLEEARKILRLFGRFEQNGTLPNMICGSDAANRETSDAPLWFVAAVRDIVEQQGKAFLDEFLGDRTIRQILVSIGDAYIRGTDTGIQMDRESALVYSPSHFTWMDTNYPAGTPRQGYPVEIQALWHYALVFLAGIDGDRHHPWKALAHRVEASVQHLFFLKNKGYFSDCLHSPEMMPAATAVADDALRPNQLFLIALGAVRDEKRCIPALEKCMALLVPGAIRTLDDGKVCHPLVIQGENGPLKDPHHPYSGHYTGNEDRERKPAYHNGTAWTWVFPVFCEAWAVVFGPPGAATGISWLKSSLKIMEKGAAGFVPEILDGDAPHLARGCDAQAWGSSELLRVWLKLTTRR